MAGQASSFGKMTLPQLVSITNSLESQTEAMTNKGTQQMLSLMQTAKSLAEEELGKGMPQMPGGSSEKSAQQTSDTSQQVGTSGTGGVDATGQADQGNFAQGLMKLFGF